jgi:ABC-type branched-subunit amino acid transport system substrate-binding protein
LAEESAIRGKLPAREGIQMVKGIKLAGALLLAVLSISPAASAAESPGVTATEIRIGGVFPFSGAASSLGLVGRGVAAYVQSINDRGGINGRKINYIALDDAYNMVWTQMQLQRWNGVSWDQFGEVLDAASE